MERLIKIYLGDRISRVIKKLPPIAALRDMAEDGTLTSAAIDGAEWELMVTNTENLNSPRIKENMREIIFTKVKTEEDGTIKQQGIFTDHDFETVLGAIIGKDSLCLDQPVSLTKLTLKFKGKRQAEITSQPIPQKQ